MRRIGCGVSLARALSVILGAVSAASCSEPALGMQTAVLDFAVESDPGNPLAGVWIVADAQPIGRSDDAGSLQVTIARKLGTPVRIEHDCPDGYRDPIRPKIVRLRDYRSVGAASVPAIEIRLRCPPIDRTAVIIVRAQDGADLEVLLDNRHASRTNSEGVAHIWTTAPPGTELSVQLDTSARPRLMPRSPRRLLTMPDADEVFVISQHFERSPRPSVRRPQRRRIIKIE